MTSLLAWLADVLTGPGCPYPACDHRARGHRTLARHLKRSHP
ncbi:hypothetical protein QWY28_13405 [Nocardioides sp. SOB77]|uniref:C2H2-type domain-containing protein n=1 Tax=Nocardioides oceani TaxID=3058369 RepID=A0ABT8FII8_9ACTN|nr:hypothetical protein [Nocardioides oceani]MDN4173952.1 hypothetical protein [Nocardioides oceani]